MPKDDEDDKRVVCECLETAGLQVEGVPQSTTRRCDLRAKSDGQAYLFEVKGFHDASAIAETLRDGKEYSNSLPYDTARAVQAGIHEAVKQLESTARKEAEELRFLALLVRSVLDPDVFFQQIVGTIFGKRSIVEHSGTSGKANLLECLFFTHSAFFKYRNVLDGAVVIDEQGAMLCVNDYGSRRDMVRKAALYRFFVDRDAMEDIAELERRGFLVADCDIDRNNVAAVLDFVKNKYNLNAPILMDFKRYSTFVPARRAEK